MKKRNFVLLMLLSVTILQGIAQTTPPCCPATKSRIQISDQEYQDRIDRFENGTIFTTLSNNTMGRQTKEAGSMPISTFFAFLDTRLKSATGLKIYFGAIDIQGDTYKQLIPIYAFTKSGGGDRTDEGVYYIYNPLKSKFELINIDVAKKYHQLFAFKTNMQVGETHSLWYSTEKLREWQKDICCQQQTPNNAITTLILQWAVYETDVPSEDNPTATIPTFGKLTLLFKIPFARSEKKKRTDDGGFDTAVPCPPGTNCIDGLDG